RVGLAGAGVGRGAGGVVRLDEVRRLAAIGVLIRTAHRAVPCGRQNAVRASHPACTRGARNTSRAIAICEAHAISAACARTRPPVPEQVPDIERALRRAARWPHGTTPADYTAPEAPFGGSSPHELEGSRSTAIESLIEVQDRRSDVCDGH